MLDDRQIVGVCVYWKAKLLDIYDMVKNGDFCSWTA